MKFDDLLFILAKKLDLPKSRHGGIGGVYHCASMARFLGVTTRQLDNLRKNNNPTQAMIYSVESHAACSKNKLRAMSLNRSAS